MKTVAAIYTNFSIVYAVKQEFSEQMPDVRLINILDDSLLADILKEGKVGPNVTKRMKAYFQSAVDAGADVIFNTCSTVGEIADAAGDSIPVPIIKIDRPMAEEAVEMADRIGVLATVPTTLGPTKRMLLAVAEEKGKKVEVFDGLAEGAFDALMHRDMGTHDHNVSKTAGSLMDKVDLFVLAQGSMARQRDMLEKITEKPVLTSTRTGVAAVKALLK